MIIHFLSALLSVASADPPTPVPAAPSTSPSPHGGPGGRATLFISPMGEPFRGQATRAAALDAWFAGADKDGNRLLSNQEMRDDAARYFATLDRVHDSEIDPDDLSYYESQIFPEVRMIGTGPGRGARYARIPGGNSTGDYGRGTDAGERLSSAGSGGGSGTLKRIPSGPEVGLIEILRMMRKPLLPTCCPSCMA